ncbi:MAG: hypothetical protein J6D47_20675 [Peptostreptococcaceae bacterium]|nr:hypothetical protein [Peptostreptococcaceae bacterium]
MYKLIEGDKVIWVDSEGEPLATGIITGIKFTSPIGNIYKVDINYMDKECPGVLTKNIHQNFLKKMNKDV